jgi:hypothetical protein
MPEPEIDVSSTGKGYPCLIITSPGGKRFIVTVDEQGVLSTTELT